MLYIVDVTVDNDPSEGHLNLRVSTSPDTYSFFVEIPLTEVNSVANIRSRVQEYCTGSELPVPSDEEIVVLTRAA
jgi:hypothetical protein